MEIVRCVSVALWYYRLVRLVVGKSSNGSS